MQNERVVVFGDFLGTVVKKEVRDESRSRTEQL